MCAASLRGVNNKVTRRSFLGWATGCATTLAAPALRAQSDRIRFGLTPVFLTNDLELLHALQAFLERVTGYDVELITRRTYQEITALLLSGRLDAAWICGYPYVHYRDKLELVAVPDWNGQPYYRSYLIVSQDRKAEDLPELEGDIHAFSDPDSNSGFLVTRTLLFERQLDPDSFFRKTLFTYGHRNVIRAVASGLAQSGSVDGYVWEVLREIEPELVARTRPLRKSEWLGFPPIATSKSLAYSPRILELRNALVSMSKSPDGQSVLSMLRLSGFEAPDPLVFSGIAAKYNMLRGVL
ncbi:PhnD/SsuA/transferrin family substrate-binding protein [Roseibium polysiphoniae]|uniref:PhnD/SsuA/transferrin family substrate-binding protein n=1 Tax=Roseibium polysiphoniae TaxID=2571221 RepID=A0ABR9C9U6_9HYPH|nr:PhnD/SsuA/transferrin family substrate-binding protein [Roseibium polysiphoniae]